jgi:hypothetical protein
MQSILAKVRPEDVIMEPFPHIIIHNAVPEDLCAALLEQYPSLPIMTQGRPYVSNQRFDLLAAQTLQGGLVSELWMEFVRTHLTLEFWREIVSLFGQQIMEVAPWLAADVHGLQNIRIGTRGLDSEEHTDLLLDANIGINTPVKKNASSVKIAHLDKAKELFAGLWYLRPPYDNSQGGDLELYRYKGTKKVFHGPRLIDKRYVEKVASIPYQNNTLILFLNSLQALHGVTPRQVTPHLRYLFNVVGIAHKPLFNLEPYRENFFQKIQRHLS